VLTNSSAAHPSVAAPSDRNSAKVSEIEVPLVASPCRNHGLGQHRVARDLEAAAQVTDVETQDSSSISDVTARGSDADATLALPAPRKQEGSTNRLIELLEEATAKVAIKVPAADDHLGQDVVPSTEANAIAVGAKDDVPQLLAIVQATCLGLADRLKAQAPTRSGQVDGHHDTEQALPTAVMAAAKAARDLLTEVEVAFLAGGKHSFDTGATTDANANASPDAYDLTHFYNVCTPVGDRDQSCPTVRQLTQWFNMGTPVGDTVSYYAAGSQMAGGSQLRLSPAHRHSCPPRPHCDDAASMSDEVLTARTRGPSRNLGDWIDELRQVDPCPSLRPPHVMPQQSPRPSFAGAPGSTSSATPRKPATVEDVPCPMPREAAILEDALS